MEKRRRSSLTAGMKKELCQYKTDHPRAKLRELIKIFSEKWDTAVGRTTVSDILRERDKWLSMSEHFDGTRRVAGGRYQELDDALYRMFVDARSRNEVITDEWFLKTARMIGKNMNLTKFRYSSGWLAGFKKRYFIGRAKIAGKYTMICARDPAIHRPQCSVKTRARRACQGGLKAKQEHLEMVQSNSAYEPMYDDLVLTGRCGVSAVEAREALVKVIAFLSSIAVREDYLCLLFNLLKYLDAYGSSFHSQNASDILVKYEDALMTPANTRNAHEQVSGSNAEVTSTSADIFQIKQESISNDDDDDDNDQNENEKTIGNCTEDVSSTNVNEGAGDFCIKEQPVIPRRHPNQVTRDKLVRRESKYAQYVKFDDASMMYKCLLCGKTFAMDRRCQRHVKLVHSGDKPFKCPVCQKTFAENATLKKHERVHTGEKPFLCTICGKNLSSSSGLIIHIRSHTGEKPFTCPDCNKSFSHSSGLAEHRRVHSTEKPYCCTMCGKAFKRSTELTIHNRGHTGEHPYKCVVCGKTFTKGSYWRIHMRRHTGEKPYACKFCSKAFSQKGLLTNHLRVHTGERPFCCTICGKCFSQSGSLYHHQKMHK